MSKLAEIEALLFVAGEEGITARQIADLLSLPPTGVVQSLEKLAQKYQEDTDTSLCLMETASRYKLVTKADYASVLRDYSRTPMNQSLSRAALETLSIMLISNRSPAWRSMTFEASIPVVLLPNLLSFDLIREDGKKEVIGTS